MGALYSTNSMYNVHCISASAHLRILPKYRVKVDMGFSLFILVSVETTEVKNIVAKFAKFPEMEFLNGILNRDLESSQTQVLSGFLPSFFLSTK